ncbi:uncharacterized protein MONOS_13801 [Monocercomonoides exilis]|uniref:uncharacterized protein n=1 Tax=Monocercomonoides exilis TaxID=2049356 RepID=UPI00355A3B49|nr:hypothetical protein MONOS_13801 [Monocercomonoides exilis]|eukprot:MONOS_13801.1-p1 / transcript=MONOS_13801.1 / gene=MONOS_13801 / organism=Monocercomonoides_exilis_PA203 / gene_product=unspecified product / transcript_product=unspecified product / location=Mono_scaffold00885:20028-22775(+) / protein_length=916 / sequence_SO=supercontig / SO=protein_coding / is_pseudo=false
MQDDNSQEIKSNSSALNDLYYNDFVQNEFKLSSNEKTTKDNQQTPHRPPPPDLMEKAEEARREEQRKRNRRSDSRDGSDQSESDKRDEKAEKESHDEDYSLGMNKDEIGDWLMGISLNSSAKSLFHSKITDHSPQKVELSTSIVHSNHSEMTPKQKSPHKPKKRQSPKFSSSNHKRISPTRLSSSLGHSHDHSYYSKELTAKSTHSAISSLKPSPKALKHPLLSQLMRKKKNRSFHHSPHPKNSRKAHISPNKESSHQQVHSSSYRFHNKQTRNWQKESCLSSPEKKFKPSHQQSKFSPTQSESPKSRPKSQSRFSPIRRIRSDSNFLDEGVEQTRSHISTPQTFIQTSLPKKSSTQSFFSQYSALHEHISSFEAALNEIISQVDEQLELIPSPPQSHLQPKSFAFPSSAQTFLREQPLPNEPRKVLSGSSADEFEISPLNSFLRSSATSPQSSLHKENHHLPHSHSSKGSEFTLQQEKSFISPSIPQEKGRSPQKTIIKRLHPAFVSRVSKERDFLLKQHFTASSAVLSKNDEAEKDTSKRSNNWSTRWDSQQHPQDLLDGCEANDVHVIEKRPAFASVPSLLLPSSSSRLTPSNTHPPDNVSHLFPTPSPQQLLWDDDPGRCRYPGSLAAIERTRSANEKKNCRNSDKNEGEKKEGVSNDVPSLTQNEEDDILCSTPPPPLIPPAIAWTKLKRLSIDTTAPPVLDVRGKDERRKEEEERQKRIDLLQSGEMNSAKGDKYHETHKGVAMSDLQKNSSNSIRRTPQLGKASCSSHEQYSECSIPSSDQAGLFPPISSLSLMAQLHDPPQTSLIPPSPQISFPAIPFNPSDVARWDSLTKTNYAQYVQGGDNSSWANENRERSGERTESAVTEDSTNQKAKERKLRQFVKETDDPRLYHLKLRNAGYIRDGFPEVI